MTNQSEDGLLSARQGQRMLFDAHAGEFRPIDVGPPPSRSVEPSHLEIEGFRHGPRLTRPRTFGAELIPPPGGLGGGVSFDEGQLLFTRSTAVSFNLLVPQNLGRAPTADLLYMTSSNRASKGCEALISFFKDRNYEAAFMIWDWAAPAQGDGSQFVVTRSFADLASYLIPVEINSAGQRRVCETVHIVNTTRQEGDAWINEVFLRNFRTGNMESVWNYKFAWPTKATDDNFWWGPIFETFPDAAQYATAPPLGFTEAYLIQDEWTRPLDGTDSALTEPTGHALTVLLEIKNSTLVAQGTEYR